MAQSASRSTDFGLSCPGHTTGSKYAPNNESKLLPFIPCRGCERPTGTCHRADAVIHTLQSVPCLPTCSCHQRSLPFTHGQSPFGTAGVSNTKHTSTLNPPLPLAMPIALSTICFSPSSLPHASCPMLSKPHALYNPVSSELETRLRNRRTLQSGLLQCVRKPAWLWEVRRRGACRWPLRRPS